MPSMFRPWDKTMITGQESFSEFYTVECMYNVIMYTHDDVGYHDIVWTINTNYLMKLKKSMSVTWAEHEYRVHVTTHIHPQIYHGIHS